MHQKQPPANVAFPSWRSPAAWPASFAAAAAAARSMVPRNRLSRVRLFIIALSVLRSEPVVNSPKGCNERQRPLAQSRRNAGLAGQVPGGGRNEQAGQPPPRRAARRSGSTEWSSLRGDRYRQTLGGAFLDPSVVTGDETRGREKRNPAGETGTRRDYTANRRVRGQPSSRSRPLG